MRTAAAFFLASLFLVPLPALADSDKDWDDCASDDADRMIAACDRIIAEGNERKVNFAIAYYNAASAIRRSVTTPRRLPTSPARSR
jgi:hypothetical protein